MENLFKNHEEFENETVGKIEGEIPGWLDGALIRTGPGKWQLDETFCMNHFLDGCAMMVKFEFNPKEQSVKARCRYLRSDAFKKISQLNRPVYTEFGTQAYSDASKSFLNRVLNKIVPSDLTDNDISNIYEVNNEVYMTTESCNIWKVDPTNLDSLMKINLDKKAGVSICSSHPIYSKEEKCLYNVGSTFLTGMKYHVFKIPVDSENGSKKDQENNKDDQKTTFDRSSIVCSFNSSYKANFAYNHSFAMTKNFIILIEQSLLVNSLKLATCTPKGKSMQDCLDWCPNEPTHFHVIDKRTNQVIKHKFHSKSFFYFHTLNAFEENDQIVIDILTHDDPALLDTLKMKNLKTGNFDTKTKAKPTRYVLPIGDLKSMKKNENLVNLENCTATSIMNSKGVIELTGQQLGPSGFEMPTINPDYVGRPYNFIYCTGFLEKGFYENAAGKLDLKNNSVTLYKQSATTYPGECVFIKTPESVDEDDGIVLTLVLETDQTKNHNLAILDAKTFKELAKIEFDRKEISIPTTLHGVWIQNSNVNVV